MKTGAIAILGALLASGCAAVPENRRPAAWPTAVRDFATTDEAVRVAAAFPNSAGMVRRRLAAALEAKDPAAAIAALRQLAAMGAALSAQAQNQVEALIGAEAMAPVAASFDLNVKPIAASRVHAVIPADHDLVEGIAWDSVSRRLYATTVVDRALLSVGETGTSVAASGGLGSLFGVAYDPVRRRLWVASASVPETPKGEPAWIGLVSIDPERAERRVRIPAPAGVGAIPGDVAVARDGNVYVSDGMNGAVYRCRPGCSALETLLAPGTLFSAQGLALSRDQKWLYIADRRYGIAALDRSSGRLFQVAGDADMMLDGIDGLALYGRDLIALQTAYQPQRIVRLRLSADGLRVRQLDVLERNHPDWGEITLGAVAGDRLFYVAGAHWSRYGEGGAPVAGAPALPTPIRVLDLR
ncbi:MAG: SMP-30/gluconolactonase/LRE family protein [Allosphingosinicella sp.]